MKKQNKTYFWLGIPAIIDNADLKSNDRIILMMIYTYLHQGKKFTMSNRVLSLLTGYPKRTVSRIISRLEKHNWIYATNKMHTFPNNSQQRVRIIYGINHKKLMKSTKDVAKRVGKKHVFQNAKGMVKNGTTPYVGTKLYTSANHDNKDNTNRSKNSTTVLPKKGTTVMTKHDPRYYQKTVPNNHDMIQENILTKPSLGNRNRDGKSKIEKNTKSKDRNEKLNRSTKSKSTRSRKTTRKSIENKYINSNYEIKYDGGDIIAPTNIHDWLCILFKIFENHMKSVHMSKSQLWRASKVISKWCGYSQSIRDDAINHIVIHLGRDDRTMYFNIIALVNTMNNYYFQSALDKVQAKKRRAINYERHHKEIERQEDRSMQRQRHENHVKAFNLVDRYENFIISKHQMYDECKDEPKVKKLVMQKMANK